MAGYDGWKRYVPVAERGARARKRLQSLLKKGQTAEPVEIQGRTIATSFWGQAWCENLESYSDYSNRLPRGRTYVRNGSVVHLEVSGGLVKALVAGSEVYTVKVEIKKAPGPQWEAIKKRCSGQISSLIELLGGRFSRSVMSVMTEKKKGLFPAPNEMTFSCSCPDWAVMCKHVAATLYGVGARLDERPELLFLLREVDETELIAEAGVGEELQQGADQGGNNRLEGEDLATLFGVEFAEIPPGVEATVTKKKRRSTIGAQAGKTGRKARAKTKKRTRKKAKKASGKQKSKPPKVSNTSKTSRKKSSRRTKKPKSK